MSGDKDIENQVPDDLSAMEDDFSDADMAGDEYADETYGNEEDFAEGDWEAYDDEESYLDDGEGDGGLASRRAAFNKFLLGGAILVALGGGFFIFKSNDQTENMGEPVMEQTGEVAAVSPDAKVEFHSDIKPPPAFGVTYGDEVEETDASEQIEVKKEGVLNDPAALARLRGREEIMDTEYVVQDASGGYQHGLQQDSKPQQPPMPSPIGAADKAEMFKNRDDKTESDLGLIPMPESTANINTAKISSGDNNDVTDSKKNEVSDQRASQGDSVLRLDEEGEQPERQAEVTDRLDLALGDGEYDPPEKTAMTAQHQDVEDVNVPVAASGADMAVLSEITESLGRISDRLDKMENSFKALSRRLDGVEKTAMKAGSSAPATRRDVSTQISASKKSSPSVKQVSAPVAKTSAKPWILKSAQPGSAMVARQGEAETYTIAVGDHFADIGRIESIAVENGRWIVSGTAGKIMQ